MGVRLVRDVVLLGRLGVERGKRREGSWVGGVDGMKGGVGRGMG